MAKRIVLSGALMLALAACGEDEVVEDTADDDGRMASGEVLEGTISDAMIPLDQLQSQAPPLRTAPTDNGEAPAATEPESPPPAPEPAPEIAPEPVIETAPPAAPAPAE